MSAEIIFILDFRILFKAAAELILVKWTFVLKDFSMFKTVLTPVFSQISGILPK